MQRRLQVNICESSPITRIRDSVSNRHHIILYRITAKQRLSFDIVLRFEYRYIHQNSNFKPNAVAPVENESVEDPASDEGKIMVGPLNLKDPQDLITIGITHHLSLQQETLFPLLCKLLYYHCHNRYCN